MIKPTLIESDFNRRGSLKSLIEFSFCGSISCISVRRKAKYEQELEEEKGVIYYLVIEDAYGFTCSYFRQGLTLEKAQAMAATLPYGKTIFINGEVAVRKGNTFFNAKDFVYPDGTKVIAYRINEEDDQMEKPAEHVEEGDSHGAVFSGQF